MSATMVAEKPALPRVSGKVTPQFAEILTPEALAFVARLHRKFEPRRQELLAARALRQAQFDKGALPDFLPATRGVR
jgi:malate synthase